jgi:hypothetical protein
MIKRSHLIGVARNPDLEAQRCDGHRAPYIAPPVQEAAPIGPCISNTICPEYALSEDLPYGDGQLYCTICGTRYGKCRKD